MYLKVVKTLSKLQFFHQTFEIAVLLIIELKVQVEERRIIKRVLHYLVTKCVVAGWLSLDGNLGSVVVFRDWLRASPLASLASIAHLWLATDPAVVVAWPLGLAEAYWAL